MYKQATIAVLIAVTFIVAAAMPATADHRPESSQYVVGNGLLVVSDDIEGTGLPGASFGGGFQLTNPLGPDAEEVFISVVDDVHGSLSEDDVEGLAAPLGWVAQCSGGANGLDHCSVFVGIGATTGTVSMNES